MAGLLSIMMRLALVLIALVVGCNSEFNEVVKIFKQVFQEVANPYCTSNTKLIKAFATALQDQKVVYSSPRQFKSFLDMGISQYKTYRYLGSYNSTHHDICRHDRREYQPVINQSRSQISMGYTLERYDYLVPNMNPETISTMLMALPPQLREKLEIRRYTIIENQLFTDHYPTNAAYGSYEKYLVLHLKDLPDMDFVMYMKDLIQKKDIEELLDQMNLTIEEYDNKLEIYKRIILDIPAFKMSKDLYSPYEFNKLLLPDMEKLEEVWEQKLKQIEEGNRKYPWETKIQKAFFRGNVSGFSHDDVDFFADIPLYFPRANLVKISRHNPDLVDAEFTGDLSAWKSFLQKSGVTVGSEIVPDVPLKQQLQYKYVIAMEGQTTDRVNLPLIMHSNSVLLKPDNGRVSWHFQEMVPNVHYVSLKRTLDNLLDKVKYLRENDQVAREISGNANFHFNERLNRANATREMISLLRKYATFQKFNPNYLTRMMYKTFHLTKMQDRQAFQEKLQVSKKVIMWVIAVLTLWLIIRRINLEDYYLKRKAASSVPVSALQYEQVPAVAVARSA